MKRNSKYIIYSIFLGVLFALIGEGIFYLIYHNDQLLDLANLIIYTLVIVYSIPIFILFKGKQWFWSILIVIEYPVLSIILAMIFGKAFPIEEGDLGAGILGLITMGINGISIISGIILGHILRFLYYQFKQYMKK